MFADPTPLKGLVGLQYLELSHNEIAKVDALAGLTKLSALYLSSNKIADIAPLGTLTNLASLYLEKAQLGWKFLTNAIARFGKDGAYQKLTHYGDDFLHDDEMAWAACQMYLATGDPAIHQTLMQWFTPGDPATLRWGWWHMCECYGHAIRSYAFAVQSGRLAANQLDATFLSKCRSEIAAAGDANMNWSKMSAYGTSFPDNTKRVKSAGWYFSTDQAFDITVEAWLTVRSTSTPSAPITMPATSSPCSDRPDCDAPR